MEATASTCERMADLLGVIPDHVIGYVSRYAHRMSPPHPNTYKDIPQYYDLPTEKMFPTPSEPPTVRFGFPGYRLWYREDRIIFPSLHKCICPNYQKRHEGEYQRNLTVFARHTHSYRGRRKRVLIYIHGWMEPGGILEANTFIPLLSVGLDADVVQLDLPFHGQRKTLGDLFHGGYFWSADLVRTMEAVRQSVMDIRTLIRWLRNEGYEEIGLMGVSLGGVMTQLTLCCEPQVDYAIPIIAHIDLIHAVQNSPILFQMRDDLEKYGISEEELVKGFERLGFQQLKPVIPREHMFFIAAERDLLLSSERIRQLWEDWGLPPSYWFPGGHLMIVPFATDVYREIKAFVKGVRKIG